MSKVWHPRATADAEIEQSRARSLQDVLAEEHSGQPDISHAILTSVARTNISTLQRGLENLTKYWSGIAWIAGSLEQRIEGLPMDKIDLVGITEKMATYVSLPDAGLAGREGTDSGEPSTGPQQPAARPSMPNTTLPTGTAPFDLSEMTPSLCADRSDFNLFSPFDFSALEGSAGSVNVTEQHMLVPQTIDPDWFRQSPQMFEDWFRQ